MLVVLVALPGVVLGVVGLAHPVFLTPETAERWRLVHLVLLPVIPLLGASVWLLLLGRRGAVAWVARGLAAAYAVLYTALDSIAGIGAGNQLLRTVERGDARPPVEDLFEVGDRLGRLGVWALALSVVLAAAVLWRTGARSVLLAGAVLAAAGSWLVLRHHVFPPRGVAGALLLGGGLALMAVAAHRRVPYGPPDA